MPSLLPSKSQRKYRSIRRLRVWLVVTVLVLCGLGTAGVTAILAQINGHSIFSVSQPLMVYEVSWYDAGILPANVPDTIPYDSVSTPNRQMTAVSDDGTDFSAAAEIGTGDQVALKLSVRNRSRQPVFGQLEFRLSEGLTMEVYAPKDSSVKKVTRISPGKWIIRVAPEAIAVNEGYINIIIAASDITQSISTVYGELTNVTSDGVSFDLNIGGEDTATSVFNIDSVVPGDSGITYIRLENIGDISGMLDIEFSSITNIGATGGGEYGDGIGDLGDNVEIAFYLDIDQSGDWNSGDIGLKSDNTTYGYPAPLEYDIINNYGSHRWNDLTHLLPFDPDDFVILWYVPDTAGNNIQGDSLRFDILFYLKQDET
jgi:hypothetical protein